MKGFRRERSNRNDAETWDIAPYSYIVGWLRNSPFELPLRFLRRLFSEGTQNQSLSQIRTHAPL
jgi:hypothetical protein